MVKIVSEFNDLRFSQNIASLGTLRSTLAARAAAMALAKASATAKSKVTGATRRRNAYVSVFSNVFKTVPRVTISSDNVAEKAFGVDVDIPASTTIDDQPAEDANFVLEEALESVTNNAADIKSMRVLAAHKVVFFEPVQSLQQLKGRKQTMTLHKSIAYNAQSAANTVWFQVVNT